MAVRKGEILIQQHDLEQTVGVVSEGKKKQLLTSFGSRLSFNMQ